MLAMKLDKIAWVLVGFISLHLAFCGFTVPHGKRSTKECNAPSYPNFSNTCNVSYTDTVRFVCPHLPNKTAATWVRWVNGAPHTICTTDVHVCDIPQGSRSLNNDDSGQYSCHVYDEPPHTTDYYVNLAVLAPPKLINQKECHGNFCNGAAVIIWNTASSINITVEYVGLGPFNVTWLLNGSNLECQMPHCHIDNTLTDKTVVTLFAPYHYTDEGTYQVTVSNHYGWNASDIKATIICDTTNPTGPAENHTVDLVIGEPATIECKGVLSASTMLYMCYAPSGTKFDSLNRNDSCAQCLGYTTGDCDTIQHDWKVSRSTQLQPNPVVECKFQITTLTIPHVHYGDGGTVYCLWSIGGMEDVYETYKVSVVLASKWYYVIGGSVLIVLASILVVFISGCYFKRRRNKRRRRSQETCLLEEPQPSTGDEVEQVEQNDSPSNDTNPSRRAHGDTTPSSRLDAMRRKRGRHHKRPRKPAAIPRLRVQSPSDGLTTSYGESPPKLIPHVGITISQVHVQDESRLPLLQARPYSTSGSSSTSYDSTGNTDAPLYTHSDSEWDLPPRNDQAKSV